MSGILARIREAEEQATLNEIPSKFEKVRDDLFGLRPRVEEAPVVQRPATKEPGDYEFEETERFDQSTLQRGEEFLSQYQQQPTMFRRDAGIDINDTYLRSLAKMEIAALNLKSNLIGQPIRIAASWAYKYIDKPEIAEEISNIRIDDDLEDFEELLIEVQFQKLKALQRADNLRIPEVSEMLSHRNYMLGNKIAGEGFKNIIALGDGLYQKFTAKKQ